MSATGDNIGMMEGAFFVGRKAILDWINEFLHLNLGRIEETCTGAIACQLCDALYPGKVNMSKVRWDAHADFEYVANYKVRHYFRSCLTVRRKIVNIHTLVRMPIVSTNGRASQGYWVHSVSSSSGLRRQRVSCSAESLPCPLGVNLPLCVLVTE